VIPRAAQPEVPWKNGFGRTREVAAEPLGAGPGAAFVWRVSIATVASDGPFSVFPGIDRRLWLLAGAGMVLDLDGREVELAAPFAEVAFPGEAKVSARLRAGPTQDLNLMCDRARVRAHAGVRTAGAGERARLAVPRAARAMFTLLIGECTVRGPGHGVSANAGDALLLDEVEADLAWEFEAQGPATWFAACFTEIEPAPRERR